MPWSSNGTYLVTVTDDEARPTVAIYKPGRAERPLWDFPDGLYRREVAAYELAEALGWRFVPETVPRADGPLGRRIAPAIRRRRLRAALLHPARGRARTTPPSSGWRPSTCIANNADRKGGHCLLDADGQLWGIDHGLCFHAEPKLRTVIWDFAGEPLQAVGPARPPAAGRLAACRPSLTGLLHRDERRALEAAHRPVLRHGRSARAAPRPPLPLAARLRPAPGQGGRSRTRSRPRLEPRVRLSGVLAGPR